MSYSPTSGLPPVPGLTPVEVWETVELVVRRLGRQFAFPGWDKEDLEQEARIHCLKVLRDSGYEPGRPLGGYLYVGASRFLMNLKRKYYRRADSACVRCHAGDYCQDGRKCKVYADWEKRQQAKASLARPADITNIADTHEQSMRTPSDVETTAGASELANLIDQHLPVPLRADYLKLLAGQQVMKARRKVVQAAILGIFARHNILLDDYKWDAFPEADLEAEDPPEPKVVRTPEAMARLNGLPEDDVQGEEEDASASAN